MVCPRTGSSDVEDAVIEAIDNKAGMVSVERWGPRWLDLFGVDRFRRRIAGISLGSFGYYFGHDQDDPQLLKRLARLRGLRHLCLCSDEWPHELRLADALASLPELRSLRIDGLQAGQWHTAAGKLSRLERLSVPYDADLCTALEHLPNLKSLAVSSCHDVEDSHRLLTAIGRLKDLEKLRLSQMALRGSSLACLSGLARLEAIDLAYNGVSDDDIAALAILPRLRSLSLVRTHVGAAGLRQLARAASLEELAMTGQLMPHSELAALPAIERLRSLHLVGGDFQLNAQRTYATLALDNGTGVAVLPSEFEALRWALETLRQSNPGILIDNPGSGLRLSERSWLDAEFQGFGSDGPLERPATWWPESEWPALSPSESADFQKQGGWARFHAAGWGPNGPTTRF